MIRPPRRPPRTSWPIAHALVLATVGGAQAASIWTFVLGRPAVSERGPADMTPMAGLHALPVWPVVVLMAVAGWLFAGVTIRRQGPRVVASVLACLILGLTSVPASFLMVGTVEGWQVRHSLVEAVTWGIAAAIGALPLAPAFVLDPVVLGGCLLFGVVAALSAATLEGFAERVRHRPARITAPGEVKRAPMLVPIAPRGAGQKFGFTSAGAALGYLQARRTLDLPLTALASVTSIWAATAFTAAAALVLACVIAPREGWRPCRAVAASLATFVVADAIAGALSMLASLDQIDLGWTGRVAVVALGAASGIVKAPTLRFDPRNLAVCAAIGLVASGLAVLVDRTLGRLQATRLRKRRLVDCVEKSG